MKCGDSCAKNKVFVAPIAQGGFANVSLVVHQEGSFERLYAIKRPHPHLLADTQMRELFIEEGRVAGLLRNPHVVEVLDVGEDRHGPYLLMPFVEGVPLAQIITAAAKESDLLPISVCLQVAIQVARGLVAAHELRGNDGAPIPLVHRDISPQNILVGYDGSVRVLDFGIAKVLSGGGQTTAHILKGKFGYMAPEQLRFEGVDARTDLYSLGVVLYEALAAERLHATRDVNEVAQSVLKGPVPDISEARGDTPQELDRLLFSLLAKAPEHRPASARETVERLERILHEVYDEDSWVDLPAFMLERYAEEMDARHSSRAEALAEARRKRRAQRLRLPAAAGAAAAAILGASVAFWPSEVTPPAEPTVVSIPNVSTPEPPPAEPEADMAPETVEVSEEEPARGRRARRRRRNRSMQTKNGLSMDWWR